MVMNLTELDTLVQAEVLRHLDHKHLNEETPPFDHIPPTSENLVAFIVEQLTPHLQGNARLYRVRLWETRAAISSGRWRHKAGFPAR
jgi:6-pyruvoyl-tetrahydropterin synthase